MTGDKCASDKCDENGAVIKNAQVNKSIVNQLNEGAVYSIFPEKQKNTGGMFDVCLMISLESCSLGGTLIVMV